MHLVPPDRADRRIIDDERVCQAITGIGDHDHLAVWGQQFAILGDPSRLALLLAIHHAGPISVSDLAVAAGINDTTVSQALRFLRAKGTVAAERDGRIIRYRLTNDDIGELLDRVTPRAEQKRRATPR